MSYGTNLPDQFRAPATTLIRFCAVRSRATSPSSSRTNSRLPKLWELVATRRRRRKSLHDRRALPMKRRESSRCLVARGRRVAAHGARASGDDAGDRVPPPLFARATPACISPGPEGGGLRRKRERGHRIPLSKFQTQKGLIFGLV